MNSVCYKRRAACIIAAFPFYIEMNQEIWVLASLPSSLSFSLSQTEGENLAIQLGRWAQVASCRQAQLLTSISQKREQWILKEKKKSARLKRKVLLET